MTMLGAAAARNLGYEPHSRGAQGRAFYVKQGVFLTIYPAWQFTSTMMAELSFVQGILTVTTGRFAWPHPNFANFERQIQSAQERLAGGVSCE